MVSPATTACGLARVYPSSLMAPPTTPESGTRLKRHRGAGKKQRVEDDSQAAAAAARISAPDSASNPSLSPLKRKPGSRQKAAPTRASQSQGGNTAAIIPHPRDSFPSYREAVETGISPFYKMDDMTYIAQVLDAAGGVITVSHISRQAAATQY